MGTRRVADCRVEFSGALNSGDFEETLSAIQSARGRRGRFVFDLDEANFACLDVLVSLLFVCNQLHAEGGSVTLKWRETAVRSYADRIGFFQHLDQGIKVLPQRPAGQLYARFKNYNQQILEMTAIPAGTDRSM